MKECESKITTKLHQMSRLNFNDGLFCGTEDDIIKRDKFEFYKRKMIKISNVTGAILTMSNMELFQVSKFLI